MLLEGREAFSLQGGGWEAGSRIALAPCTSSLPLGAPIPQKAGTPVLLGPSVPVPMGEGE